MIRRPLSTPLRQGLLGSMFGNSCSITAAMSASAGSRIGFGDGETPTRANWSGMTYYEVRRTVDGKEETMSRHESPMEAGRALVATAEAAMRDVRPSPPAVTTSYCVACIEDGVEREPTDAEQGAIQAGQEQGAMIQAAHRTKPDVSEPRLDRPEDR
jgi:hypothetical protein